VRSESPDSIGALQTPPPLKPIKNRVKKVNMFERGNKGVSIDGVSIDNQPKANSALFIVNG
jgi:hypothetical protein